MHIFKKLKDADTSKIPNFSQYVTNYFPNAIQQQYKKEIQNHMLFKSIGLTVILNEVVGDAGAWLLPGIMDISGAKPEAIIGAWLLALETIDAQNIRRRINEECPNLNAKYAAWEAVTRPIYSLVVHWLFSQNGIPSSENRILLTKILEEISNGTSSLQKERILKTEEELKTKEVPDSLAKDIAVLEELLPANEISKLITNPKALRKAVVSFYSIGQASQMLPIIRKLEERRSFGGWDPAANAILQFRFCYLLQHLCKSIDLGRESQLGIDRVTLRLNRFHLKDFHNELEDILKESTDLAGLIVANARAQNTIKTNFSPENPIKGTGLQ